MQRNKGNTEGMARSLQCARKYVSACAVSSTRSNWVLHRPTACGLHCPFAAAVASKARSSLVPSPPSLPLVSSLCAYLCFVYVHVGAHACACPCPCANACLCLGPSICMSLFAWCVWHCGVQPCLWGDCSGRNRRRRIHPYPKCCVSGPLSPVSTDHFSSVFLRAWARGFPLTTRRGTRWQNHLPPAQPLDVCAAFLVRPFESFATGMVGKRLPSSWDFAHPRVVGACYKRGTT